MLFDPNTITGTAISFHRNFEDNGLSVTIREANNTDTTLLVYDGLADQIERVLFERRRRRQPVTLTLAFNPATGTVTNFSVIS